MFTMKAFRTALITLSWVISLAAATNAPPLVDLGYVKYTGYHNETAGINYFRGIPYAQPPLGDLRWRKPRPIEDKNDFDGKTFSAVNPGAICIQGVPASVVVLLGPPPPNQSEDCLVLDVLVPAKPVSERIPVLVEIHPGGYVLGEAGLTPGDALVYASRGQMIYVAIQYRLGMFGFLAGSEIQKDGDANAGLFDQRAALEWVQRNIDSFGGDPSKVTIWGGSSGGGSVSCQLIAGGAVDKPPFRAAIAEYPWWQPLMNTTTQESQYQTVLRLANCKGLECLRSASSQQLQQVSALSYIVSYPSAGYGNGIFYYGPVVDGEFIKNLPSQEFMAGNFYKVPVMVDHDAYEGVIFTNSSLTTQAAETVDAKFLFPYAGPSFFSRLYQLYPASNFNSTFFQRQTWFGDFIINCKPFPSSRNKLNTIIYACKADTVPGPTYYMATAISDHGSNSSAVFKMIFSAGNQLHGATGAFLYSANIGFPSAPNSTIADIMSSYWISFVVTGDPNPLRSRSAPFWPSYNSNKGGTIPAGESFGFSTLAITVDSTEIIVDTDASAQCDFFLSQSLAVSN